MKKMLLSAALMMAAFAANAQVEIATVDAAALGLNKDAATAVAAGTVVAQTESVIATVKYDDNFKCVGMKTGAVMVNGEQVSASEGDAIQGSTNVSGSAANATSYQTAGCIYEFTPNKDGYIYVIISASGNKCYAVYENETDRVPYMFSMQNTNDVAGAPAMFSYDLMAIEGATYYMDGVGYYVNPDFAIAWPCRIVMGPDASLATTGNGVIKFQAYNGCTYQVFATGSKMTLAGFAFDTTGDATVTTDTNTLLSNGQIPGGDTGISEVVVNEANDANAPVYNIAGQRVSNNAKGLVIVNGKKYMRK